MKFYITFNRPTSPAQDKKLKLVGATEECYEWGCQYEINIDSLEELEDLEKLIYEKIDVDYFLIVSVEDRSIYLDK
jgi:hypothetical protein